MSLDWYQPSSVKIWKNWRLEGLGHELRITQSKFELKVRKPESPKALKSRLVRAHAATCLDLSFWELFLWCRSTCSAAFLRILPEDLILFKSMIKQSQRRFKQESRRHRQSARFQYILLLSWGISKPFHLCNALSSSGHPPRLDDLQGKDFSQLTNWSCWNAAATLQR